MPTKQPHVSSYFVIARALSIWMMIIMYCKNTFFVPSFKYMCQTCA